jgi:hypothetical protein
VNILLAALERHLLDPRIRGFSVLFGNLVLGIAPNLSQGNQNILGCGHSTLWGGVPIKMTLVSELVANEYGNAEGDAGNSN